MSFVAETTLTRRVLDQLGQAIVTGVYPGGSVLRIQDLQTEFGVSRTVIRDALRSLKSMNLVEAKRSIGITVRYPHEWDVYARDVIRWRLASKDWRRQLQSLEVVRVAIEPIAAALTARSNAHEHVGQYLDGIANAMREAGLCGDLEASLKLDLEFHLSILHRSGNEMLAALDGVVELVLRARHDLHLRPNRPHEVPMILHSLVSAAIREGDAQTAESAMRHLVTEVIEDVTRHASDDAEGSLGPDGTNGPLSPTSWTAG